MRLAAHFGQHVIYDLAVLMLWAKQHNVGILGDLDRVSGWPIKKVTVSSTGRCNSTHECIRRSGKAQDFTRALIQSQSDSIEFGL